MLSWDLQQSFKPFLSITGMRRTRSICLACDKFSRTRYCTTAAGANTANSPGIRRKSSRKITRSSRGKICCVQACTLSEAKGECSNVYELHTLNLSLFSKFRYIQRGTREFPHLVPLDQSHPIRHPRSAHRIQVLVRS